MSTTASRRLGFALGSFPAPAHPGAGIVVDRLGRTFFTDTGAGVWKADRQGRLGRRQGEAFHGMAIDHRGGFTGRDVPRRTGGEPPVVGPDPTPILSSDFPIAVGRDGALYDPHRVKILHAAPGGKPAVVASASRR